MPPTLSSLGEFGLVGLFGRAAQARHPATRVGIGDDCAVLDLGGPARVLLTTDLLLERVHFEAAWLSAEDLGHKAMAVNLSDVAAMGGEAVAALLALGLPPGYEVAWVEGFRDGLCACARPYGVELVGGDTVSAPVGAVVCLSVLGRAPAGEVVLRSGGLPGDRVLVAGTLGDSAAGLHLLRGHGAGLAAEHRAALLRAHRRPEPQLALGRELAGRRLVHAMIDVSDGLLADLGHIARASGLGAVVDDAALPWAALHAACADRTAVRDALLAGGDDYELLFCAPREAEDALIALSARLALPLTRIGAMQAGEGVRLVDATGAELPVGRRGYDHFA